MELMQLIVNGDDFGMNERCSRAIAQAFALGLITDTTVMTNGVFFDGALALAREQGFFEKLGVHFNLTEGEPLTQSIKSLPKFVSDGRFHKRFLQAPHPLTDWERDAVFRELCAQAQRLLRAGVRITHADSHHYIHNLTPLAPIVAEVCKACGIRKIRLNRTFDTPERPLITENRIDNAWWREQGFVTAYRFGRLSDVTGGDIPDCTEIMVHPDFDRDGVLINRTGMRGGSPTGDPLCDLRLYGAELIGYSEIIK